MRKWFARFGINQHRLFLVGLALKTLDGLLEAGAGITLLILGTGSIKHIIWLWTSAVLSDDSDNAVAHHVARWGAHLSPHRTIFIALYLTLHGALKLGLVIALMIRIIWAYPVAAALLVAFIGFQIYRLTQNFSYVLVTLTCIDAAIALLIMLEYGRLRHSAR